MRETTFSVAHLLLSRVLQSQTSTVITEISTFITDGSKVLYTARMHFYFCAIPCPLNPSLEKNIRNEKKNQAIPDGQVNWLKQNSCQVVIELAFSKNAVLVFKILLRTIFKSLCDLDSVEDVHEYHRKQ